MAASIQNIFFLIVKGTAFVFPTLLLGQTATDNENRIIRLPNENKRPSLLSPKEYENPFLSGDLFKKPLDIADPKSKLNTPNFSNREQFLDPGAYHLSKLNREGEDKKKYKKVDQYLGDIRNNGKFVEIIFRDHEVPDGDRIKVLLNDKTITPNVFLDERFKGVSINLVYGFNRIDFVALNQGTSGPNTAEVRIYNDNGEVIAANRWNLATGAKATYIVIKEQ